MEKYPNYSKVVKNRKINKEGFNKYVEKALNDNNFVLDNFVKIVQKS